MGGLVAIGSVIVLVGCIAIAIPISVIANRLGHPRWIAYAVWILCPLVLNVLIHIHERFISLAMIWWLPGLIYLWVLAFSKGHDMRKSSSGA